MGTVSDAWWRSSQVVMRTCLSNKSALGSANRTGRQARNNRYKSTLSMMYGVGIENNKIKTNPARLLKHKREENRRVRFLNQNTEDEYERLRSVIEGRLACHLPEFHIALYTGMRPSEQYALTWERVDLILCANPCFYPRRKAETPGIFR